MGLEIDEDDPVWGSGCAYFPDPAHTPEKIYVNFCGVIECPSRSIPPNGRTFVLLQHPASHCYWRTVDADGGYFCSLQYIPGPPRTSLLLWDILGRRVFGGNYNGWANEHHVFDNTNPDCSDSFSATGGKAVIMWLLAASNVLTDFTIPMDVKVLWEFFTTSAGVPIYKFCIPKYTMNIKFKITP